MDLNLTKEQQLILLGLIVSIVVGLGVMSFRNFAGSSDRGIVIEEPADKTQLVHNFSVLVHVCGAVRREGVYKLRPGDRLLEALKVAGGALPSADLSALNLAEAVKDGQKIMVPCKSVINAKMFANSPQLIVGNSAQKVNLNTADEKTLDSLPGVGPATAKAIIEYRRTNGSFTRIEQIMEIPRFGKSKFEKVRDRITI